MRWVDRLDETLKLAAAALEDAGLPYLLGGGLAAWALGAPKVSQDVDLVVKPADAEAALAALADAGMRTERPPEQWLLKAYNGETLVDVIFAPRGLEVDDELIARGSIRNVAGMEVPVMAVEDVLTAKLLALDEHAADFGPLIAVARALREQIDWPELRRRTAGSPFAVAFMTLVAELGIVAPAAETAGGHHRHVRVLDEPA